MPVRNTATLTNLAQGWTNRKFVHTVLLPVITVPNTKCKLPVFGKEGLRVFETFRGEYADSNVRITEGRDKLEFDLKVHNLSYPIDKDYTDAEDLTEEERHGAEMAQDGIALSLEKSAADMLQNPSTFPTGHKITLSGTSQFNDPTSDPISVVKDGIKVVRAAIGYRPNVMIIGASVYDELIDHPKLQQTTTTGEVISADIEVLKKRFKMKEIVIGEGIWADFEDNVSDLWGKSIVMAYVHEVADAEDHSKYNMSLGYTPRHKGYPTSGKKDADEKVYYIENNDRVLSLITCAEAGYLISDAIA